MVLGNLKEEMSCAEILAHSHIESGDLMKAQKVAEAAVTKCKGQKDTKRMARMHHLLAEVQYEREQYDNAADNLKKARMLFRKVGDLTSEANVLETALKVHIKAKDIQKALWSAKDARQLWRRTGEKFKEAAQLMEVIQIQQARGRESLAKAAAFEAAKLASEVPHPFLEGHARMDLAQCQLADKEYEEGLQTSRLALSLFQEGPDASHHNQYAALDLAANVLLSVVIKESEELQKDKAVRRKGYEGWLKQSPATKEALAALQEALDFARMHCEDKDGQANALLMMARALLVDARGEEGMEKANLALTMFREQSDERGEASAIELISVIGTSLGKSDAKSLAVAAGGEVAKEAEIDPEMFRNTIVEVTQSMLGTDDIASDTPLMDAGLDSLSMVEFRNELVKLFPGVTLPGALLFDAPTVNALTDFIVDATKNK